MRIPHPAVQVEVVTDHIQYLNAADEQRHQHGDRGDCHVVIELARSDGHTPSRTRRASGFHQLCRPDTCPRSNNSGRNKNRPDRQMLCRRCRRDAEQSDLRGRIEAQAEEKSDDVHFPAAIDEIHKRPTDAADPAELLKHLVEGHFRIRLATIDPDEGAHHRPQDQQIDRGHQQQKSSRDRGADEIAESFELRKIAIAHRLRSRRSPVTAE